MADPSPEYRASAVEAYRQHTKPTDDAVRAAWKPCAHQTFAACLGCAEDRLTASGLR